MKLPNLIARFTALPKKQRILYGSGAAGALVIILFLLITQKTVSAADLSVTPTYGDFAVTITVTGELEAKNSIEIKGPEEARAAGIWQMKISNLVAEGTVVKKGNSSPIWINPRSRTG
jgi:multidrug efflux pump subunit AcrA (membrane-fusion protein)